MWAGYYLMTRDWPLLVHGGDFGRLDVLLKAVVLMLYGYAGIQFLGRKINQQ